ncbi:bifunctional 4-hydroxy-2-oxoglutarate aldolase/2-dehydro-3-deoxy-phosphogluconate aldolase [Daejeonella sp.]|uniref:bifunctional 4-hydroxy-2-oxoglutarate aldolase/2-dehydro-3-deoxy-phosphogluconate aldolase n=1 Tax=Daejeonella sp. TaxID=2805397 RepID=UPI003983A614
MNKKEFFWDIFNSVPIVGIIRGHSLDELKQILPVYVSSGLTTVEITLNTTSAAELIRYAVDNYGEQLNVGAGTVCNENDLENALSAGAQFIVTPIINEAVIKSCVQQKIPIFPGAFTATEIYRAWELGASIVKVFPATSVGSGYIKDIKGPFDQIKLMPTGGITKDNIGEFMKAGSDGLGIGSQLFDRELIEQENWKGLEEHFRGFVKYFI